MRSTASVLLVLALCVGFDASPSAAQQVAFHGYLTQGVGSTSDYAQAGLSTGTTADIRAAALQGRLIFPSLGTQLVVQGAHRRVGGSPVADVIDDVELDWAFVQSRQGDFSARVGRVPLPKGLLNEVRDVGLLLPFYRAPNAFYTAGIETIDGAALGFSRYVGPFEVDAQGFYGKIPVVIQIGSQTGPEAMDMEGTGTWGAQLSVGLPGTGVRIIGGRLDSDVMSESMGPVPVEVDWEMHWYGAEYRGDRIFARAEKNNSLVPSSTENGATYFQAGYNAWKGLWVNGQRETGFVRIIQMGDFEYDSVKDWAAGLSYAFTPQLMLKGEYHWSNGFDLDEAVNLMGEPVENNYFVLSLSAAF